MDQAAAKAGPQGLFKRDTKGLESPPVRVRVDRDRILFFAKVLGERSSFCTNLAASRAAGHPDLVAPPSFFMVIEALAREELARQGHPGTLEAIGCDFRYLLHGDESYAYFGLIYAGDEVSITTRVVDFSDRKGGAMELVVLESTVAHAERGVLVSARRTLIHKLV